MGGGLDLRQVLEANRLHPFCAEVKIRVIKLNFPKCLYGVLLN
jgi:hypothetical protein